MNNTPPCYLSWKNNVVRSFFFLLFFLLQTTPNTHRQHIHTHTQHSITIEFGFEVGRAEAKFGNVVRALRILLHEQSGSQFIACERLKYEWYFTKVCIIRASCMACVRERAIVRQMRETRDYVCLNVWSSSICRYERYWTEKNLEHKKGNNGTQYNFFK